MSQEAQVPPGNRWKRLGDLLLDAGLITQGQLSEGLAEKERQKHLMKQLKEAKAQLEEEKEKVRNLEQQLKLSQDCV